MNYKEIGIVQRVKILQIDDPKPQHSLKLIVEIKKQSQFSIQPSEGSFENDNQESVLSIENNLDDSLEMSMMELTIDPARKVLFEQEKDITQYLKNKGVRLKTDPRCKQDKYFVQNRRRQQKALTTFQVQPVLKQQNSNNYLTPNLSSRLMELKNNLIMQRRTPNVSPSSTPLLESKSLTFKQDQSKKSRFFMNQQQE